MKEPSSSTTHPPKVHETLHNHHLMRTAHPGSLASLDSGHATQYTQSTASSHTVNSRGGPMRATVRPRGIVDHIPPTLCSVSSNSSTSSRKTHSRHRSLTPQASNSGHASSEVDTIPFQGNLNSYQRSQSMEALHSKENDDCEDVSHHSYPSSLPPSSSGGNAANLQYSTRNTSVGMENCTRHSSSCGELRAGADYNKENESNSMRSTTRKANSEMGGVNGRQVSSNSTPFRDRTNKSRVENNGKPKSNSVSAASDKPRIKTLNELVPPLNAARLRPIQQQTRSANVMFLLY